MFNNYTYTKKHLSNNFLKVLILFFLPVLFFLLTATTSYSLTFTRYQIGAYFDGNTTYISGGTFTFDGTTACKTAAGLFRQRMFQKQLKPIL